MTDLRGVFAASVGSANPARVKSGREYVVDEVPVKLEGEPPIGKIGHRHRDYGTAPQ